MTEAEYRAAEIWQAVRDRNMPRGLALDAVQDVCGERGEAVSLLLAAAARDAEQRWRKFSERTWRKSHVRGRAKWILEQMTLRNWEAADRERRNIGGSRYEHDWEGRYVWKDWLHEMKLVIRLCRELCEAA